MARPGRRRTRRDELLVAYATATAGVDVVNAGAEPLVAYLLSGPDLHPEAAHLGGTGGGAG